MPAGTAAIVFGILFIIVGIILIFVGLWYVVIDRKRDLTTGQKWLYWGLGTVFVIIGIILAIIGAKVNHSAVARQLADTAQLEAHTAELEREKGIELTVGGKHINIS
jgi:uncharacterized membrane protein YidH (DUF202 family)